MGYRSEVVATFYVSSLTPDTPAEAQQQREKAESLFKVWWAANFKGEETTLHESFKPLKAPRVGYLLQLDYVKWYDSYPSILWFNGFAEKFREDLCDNEGLDGGSGLHNWFAYEFARVGEEHEDIEMMGHGNIECVLNVERTITIDVCTEEV